MEGKKRKKNRNRKKWNINKEIVPQVIYETEEDLYAYAVKMMGMDRLIVQFTYKIENYLEAARMFDELGEYKDSVLLAQKCRTLAEKAKKEETEYFYQLAVKQKSNAKDKKDFDKASKLFKRAAGYKDADQLDTECLQQIKLLKKKNRFRQLFLSVVILICAAAVVWFLNTPAWETMQKQMIEMNKVISTEMPNR